MIPFSGQRFGSELSKDVCLSHGLRNQAFSEFMENLERIPLLAHHPDCQYHHNHLIWIGKLPLCLGCSMMSCGIISGFLLIPHLTFLTDTPFYVPILFGVLLYIPAIFQVWIQFKAYKIASRFCLGIAVFLMIYGGLWLTPWSWLGLVLKAGFLGEFYLVWKLTLKVRSQYSKSPCDSCPKGRFPLCSYTVKRIPRFANKYFADADGTNPEADDFVRGLQQFYITQKHFLEQ